MAEDGSDEGEGPEKRRPPREADVTDDMFDMFAWVNPSGIWGNGAA